MRGTLPANDLRCVAFSPTSFTQIVRQASAANENSHSPLQVHYLGLYLQALGAQSLVVEAHYVDRHYIEEDLTYYRRCLLQRPSFCVRIHAFRGDVSEGALTQFLQRASTGALQDVTTTLNDMYLGYIVVRPLPSVPIGRTVLRPPLSPDRVIATTCSYPVHLAGIELHVEGLGFQQQDRAVGACATTAVWTALQRVCRMDGSRPPTPSAISEAAFDHLPPYGRPYPAPGLTPKQICSALSGFGFPPEVFEIVALRSGVFMAQVQSYLRSGIPVILEVSVGPGRGHAVTAVGYQRATKDVQYAANQDPDRTFTFHNADVGCLFLHDDRCGPYAVARPIQLAPESVTDTDDVLDEFGDDRRTSRLRLAIEVPEHGDDIVSVRAATVPLYPKLRTNALELVENAGVLLHWIQSLVEPADRIGLETFFNRSGTYLASLYGAGLNPARLIPFTRSVVLSRYIGINRWYVNGQLLLDVLWDTTDTMRDGYVREHLLGLVSYQESIVEAVAQAAKELGVPCC